MFRMKDDEFRRKQTRREMRRAGYGIVKKPSDADAAEQEQRLREWQEWIARWKRRGYRKASDREPL